MGMPYFASTTEYKGFKPCPFCGEKRQAILERLTSWVPGRVGSVYMVHCSCGCNYSTDIIATKGKTREQVMEEIIEEWNGRVG